MRSTIVRFIVTLILIPSLFCFGTEAERDRGEQAELEKDEKGTLQNVKRRWADDNMDSSSSSDSTRISISINKGSSSSSGDEYCCKTNHDCKGFRICVKGNCVCHPSFVEVHENCIPLSCIGETCHADVQCKGNNTICDEDRKICLCEPGLILTQDGNCVNCSKVDRNSTEACLCFERGEECNCDNTHLDLIVIIDASSPSFGYPYYRQRNFVSALAMSFSISPTQTRFGFISFSTKIRFSTNLTDPASDSNLELDLLVQTHIHWTGTRRIDLAIKEARGMLQFPDNRPGVPNVVVLLTDGQTNDGGEALLPGEVALLHNITDTRVFVIGIGLLVNPVELEMIASSPSNVIYTPHDDLVPGLELLLAKLCFEMEILSFQE